MSTVQKLGLKAHLKIQRAAKSILLLTCLVGFQHQKAHRKSQNNAILVVNSHNFALGLCCEVIVYTCRMRLIGNFNKVWWVEFLSYIATHIHIVQRASQPIKDFCQGGGLNALAYVSNRIDLAALCIFIALTWTGRSQWSVEMHNDGGWEVFGFVLALRPLQSHLRPASSPRYLALRAF
jgi:hypothetical protein